MWQAIGSKTSDRTGWRNNIKGINGNCDDWSTNLPDRIREACQRLQHMKGYLVQIENKPAAELIKRHRRKNVFIYADPPYVMSTKSKRIYACEMTDKDHVELLELLRRHPGPVMISGYENEIYSEYLKDWHSKTRVTSCEHGLKREEVIWMNYDPPAKQLSLLG